MLRNVLLLQLLLCFSSSAWALFTWTPETGWSRDWERISDTAKEQYERALVDLKEGRYEDAYAQFGTIPQYFPDSPYVEDALFYEGVALFKGERNYRAFIAFGEYIKAYPASARVDEAFGYQFDVAYAFQQGAKKEFPFTSWKIIPAREEAVTIYEEIIKQDPYGAYGARAQFEIGHTWEDIGDYESSLDAYNRVIDRYGDTEWAQRAKYRKSIVYQMQNKGADYNKKPLKQAVENLTLYEHTLKNTEERKEIRQTIVAINVKRAKSMLGSAQYYEKIDKPKAALIYYKKVTREFPGTEVAQKAEERIQVLEAIRSSEKQESSE